MKELAKGLGKAFLYFLVYLAAQVVVSFGVTIVVSAQLTMETMAQGQQLDDAVLYEQVLARVMELSALVVIISGILALFIYWLIFVIRKKKLMSEVSLGAMDVRGILPVILLGVSFDIVITLLLIVVPFPQSWMDSYVTNSNTLVDGNVFVNWIAVVIMAPVVEEIVFRGLVYTRLKKGMPALAAAILSSMVFGVMHGTIIWFCYTFVFGMLLVWCYEKFQSLAANILLHMSFNLTGHVLSMVSDIPDAAAWVMGAMAAIVMVVMVIFIRRMCISPENGMTLKPEKI